MVRNAEGSDSSVELKRQSRKGRHWGGDRASLCHCSLGKEVGYILLLGKDQAKPMREDFNAKEIS